MIDRENIKKLFESKNMDSSTLEDLISFYSLSSKLDKDHIDLLFNNDDFQKKISLLSNNREYSNSKIDKTENDSELSLEYMGLCNIDWLRYFVVFAESVNTYDASEKLHITHQALSKALGGIEKHFKIKLIERSKNYKGLTLAGQELLEKSRVVIQQLYSIEKYFNDLRVSNLKGFLKIGISKCYNKDLFSDILIKFYKKNPDVYPQIYSMTSDEIETAISIGEIEIGLTKKTPKRQETEYLLVSKTPYVIVGKPQEKRHWRDFSYIISKSYNTSNNYFDAWQDDKFERKIIAEGVI